MRTKQQSSQRKISWAGKLIMLAVIFLFSCSQKILAQQWSTSANGADISNTNSGNVGVGTSSPDHKLDVVSSSGTWTARFKKSDASHGGILIDSAAGFNPNIGLSVNGAYKWFMLSNSGNGDALQFWESTGWWPRLSISQAGNVGIGTNTPTSLQGGFTGLSGRVFQIRNDAGVAQLNISATGASNVSALGFEVGDATATKRFFQQMYDGANNVFKFRILDEANGAVSQDNILVLKNTGDVGIGTDAPAYKLDLNGNLNVRGGTTFFRQSSGLAGNEGAYLSIGATANNEASLSLNVYRAGAYASRFTVNNFGQIVFQPNGDANVGIGVPNPAYKFDVQGGQVNASGGLCIAGDCKTAWSQVGGGSQWTSGANSISYSAGNVGIGTSGPGGNIDIRDASGRQLVLANASVGNHSFFNSAANAHVSGNLYWNQTNWNRFDTTRGGAIVDVRGDLGVIDFLATPAGANPVSAFTTAMRIDNSGNVGIGTTSPQYKLDVAGNINSSATITGNNIVAKYQDMAEWVPSSEQLAAGTVVVLDSSNSNQVIASTQVYDTRVAGVISEQPGIALGEKSENKVLVATMGRVRVKVDATKSPIHIGDLLVTSDIPGVAMKSEPIIIQGRQIHAPGTLIGKALEPLAKGQSKILVLLSLQ